MQYPNMTDEERAKALCKISDLNFKMFKSPEEIDKVVDLSGEGYQFVRIAEQKDGKKAFLRLFNDNQRHPRETEITAMLKRFVAKAPMVAFSTGYGSRSINNYGGRGFYLFAKDLWFRYSLLIKVLTRERLIWITRRFQMIFQCLLFQICENLYRKKHWLT